jgi:hypothetical protein
MDPKQIGGVGLGATAGGGILGAFGSLASGVANSGMYDYQASVARLNAQIDKQNAEYSVETGREQEQQFGFKAGAQLGQIRASQASSGFDVRSGSAAQVQTSQQQLDRLGMQTIRSNAAKTAYNYETQAAVSESQAGLYKKAGANSLAAGGVGAMSSLLGSAASVSNEWLSGQRIGLWGKDGGGTSTSTGDDNYTSLFGT